MSDDNPFGRGCAWVQGEYVPIADAKISLLDVGFSRSDVTHDVVAVWDGKFFRLEEHLDRFERSMKHLHMSLDFDRVQIAETPCAFPRRPSTRRSRTSTAGLLGRARRSALDDPDRILNPSC